MVKKRINRRIRNEPADKNKDSKLEASHSMVIEREGMKPEEETKTKEASQVKKSELKTSHSSNPKGDDSSYFEHYCPTMELFAFNAWKKLQPKVKKTN